MASPSLLLLLLAQPPAAATEGFYKDLFMDSGYSLTQRDELHAAEQLGLSYDVMITEDSSVQNLIMVASDEDSNGILLYPDGSPRYRVIYTNGGSATTHGTSLGEEGRQRVRDFVDGGGSYTGSCAGAFLSMLHYDLDDYLDNGAWDAYYHLWPGVGDSAYTAAEYHDIVFYQTDHPLVAMYPSLADGLVEDVYHNYGCRFDPDHYDNPVETEYIGVNHDPSTPALDGYYNIMAYKADQDTGRVVVTCSHPESYDYGERLDLTSAIIQYALDGQGEPWPEKGVLDNGIPLEMTRDQELLGDLQYHYWTVELPEAVESAEFTLDGLTSDCDLYARLGSRPDRLAYDEAAVTAGLAAERIQLDAPEPGTWYLGAYGAHEELNGSEYVIAASWVELMDTGDPAPDDTGYQDDQQAPEHRGWQQGNCGCASGSGPAGYLALLLGGMLLRRRRRA